MNNLFSIFDPQASFNLPFNWSIIFGGLMILPLNYWGSASRYYSVYTSPVTYFLQEVKALISSSSALGKPLILIALFSLIMVMNVMGLLPFVFTPTSHLSISLSLALPLWLGHMLWASSRATNLTLAHLAPSGAPMALGPFMVLIEVVSSIIRPLTLSVRLAANMVAGHLLLCLLGSSLLNLNPFSLMFAFLPLLLLLTLELAVALIQAYVFAMLSSLYLEEVETPAL